MAELLHGTAIAAGDHGVLLRGPSGSGKSDLALRCIGQVHQLPLPGPVLLVADDQVHAELVRGSVVLSPPVSIAGLIEVRGVGITKLPHAASARLALVLDLVAAGAVERLPDQGKMVTIAGIEVAHGRLTAFEASAPLKVLLALDRAIGGPTSYRS